MVICRRSRYEVSLPVFEGPLDLLLSLIEREQLDITTISLAQVTDQYLAYLAQLDRRRVGELADFLVVAAKLLWIKSRALLPHPPTLQPGEAEQAGEELVHQLQVYRQFKAAAAFLSERDAQALRSYLRLAQPVLGDAVSGRRAQLDLGPITVWDLLRAAQAVLGSLPAPPVDEVVRPITVTVVEQIERIRGHLQQRKRITFREVLSELATRVEVIVTLLALLEMVKQHVVRAYQETLFGEIFIERLPADETIADASLASSSLQ